jgi:nucleoside-diphosphate-sugar epimerase
VCRFGRSNERTHLQTIEVNDRDIIDRDATILVTGAAGFVGVKVVQNLVRRGFRSVRCLVRPASDLNRLEAALAETDKLASVHIVRGDLVCRDNARAAAQGAAVVYHLAAGTGLKSHASAFMNSVVTTRNLLDALVEQGTVKRFVSVSSFAVYSNKDDNDGNVLDENSPIEAQPQTRAEAYCYAKVKQDALVIDYGKRHRIPFVLIRPGVVYGPGKTAIPGRVGIGTSRFFLHLGGASRIPFTYVDNCADAIVLSGLKPGLEGEVFNVVDDDLPTSRQFLRAYKRNVRPIRSVYLPKSLSYFLSFVWEQYSEWSHYQLPPVFTRREWHAYWKAVDYSNEKIKLRLGWQSSVTRDEGLRRYFASCRKALAGA